MKRHETLRKEEIGREVFRKEEIRREVIRKNFPKHRFGNFPIWRTQRKKGL